MNTAATGNTAHVVKLWRGKRLRHFPLARKLTDVRLSLLVNLKGAEVTCARGFVEGDVGSGAVFPVLGEGSQMLYPLLSAMFVCSLCTESVCPIMCRKIAYL
jgi:hypothetical protein